MLIAVNVGNTQTKLGVFKGEELRGRWRMTTESQRTEDEIGASLTALLELRGMRLRDLDALIIASDVPDLIRSYRRLGEDLLEIPFYSVSYEMKTDLANLYEDPRAVGSDRIVYTVAV